MCGRFHLDSTLSQVLAHYDLSDSSDSPMPTGEIFPGTRPYGLASHDGVARLAPMFWGARPFQIRGRRKQPINAKAESLFSSRYWRPAVQAHRCLIPANSWDEWQKSESGTKTRWRIQPRINDPIFSFGGVYMRFTDGDGNEERGFAIITQPVSDALSAIHDRQPLIVMPEHYGVWLAQDTPENRVEKIVHRQGRNYNLARA